MQTARCPPWKQPDYQRPRRSGAARRAQATRANARVVSKLLKSFEAVSSHRGCANTKLATALVQMLASSSSSPTPCSQPPADHTGTGSSSSPSSCPQPLSHQQTSWLQQPADAYHAIDYRLSHIALCVEQLFNAQYQFNNFYWSSQHRNVVLPTQTEPVPATVTPPPVVSNSTPSSTSPSVVQHIIGQFERLSTRQPSSPVLETSAPMSDATTPMPGATILRPATTTPVTGSNVPMSDATTSMPGATILRPVVSTPLTGCTTPTSDVTNPVPGAAILRPDVTTPLPGSTIPRSPPQGTPSQLAPPRRPSESPHSPTTNPVPGASILRPDDTTPSSGATILRPDVTTPMTGRTTPTSDVTNPMPGASILRPEVTTPPSGSTIPRSEVTTPTPGATILRPQHQPFEESPDSEEDFEPDIPLSRTSSQISVDPHRQRERILTLVLESSQPVTSSSLAATTGIDQATVRTMLYDIRRSGQILSGPDPMNPGHLLWSRDPSYIDPLSLLLAQYNL